MRTFLLLLLLFPLSSFALELDEKLTVRIMKTSESRKTLMINRGTEDGVVEGDHARFIVTAGIVARAVCVRVSPTRSVWSVYRLVNADFIVNDAVMTLKVTAPVKVTKDATQALVQDDTPSRVTNPRELGIPLADGAQDLDSMADTESASELAALGVEEAPASLVEKNVEVFGMLNVSALSARTKTESSDTFDNSQASHHFGLGVEYYSRREREWYSRFSLAGSLNMMRNNNQAYTGAGSTTDVTEFSAGINWHPGKLPSLSYAFIPFVNVSVSMGTVKSTFTPGNENAGGEELNSNGNTSGFALGFGYKFYTNRGFGVRALADYYVRAEKYKEDDATNIYTKAVSGPRLMLGLSYRF